jgi:hypothetical protein
VPLPQTKHWGGLTEPVPHVNAGPTSLLLISMVFYDWQCSISYSVEGGRSSEVCHYLVCTGVLRFLTFFRTAGRNSIPTMDSHVHVEPPWNTQAELWL